MTPDGRYFVVRGRLWRMANPDLNEAERADLVGQLMAAQRAVRVAECVPRGRELGIELGGASERRDRALELLLARLAEAEEERAPRVRAVAARGRRQPAIQISERGPCLRDVGKSTHFPGQGQPVSFAIPITASRGAGG